MKPLYSLILMAPLMWGSCVQGLDAKCRDIRLSGTLDSEELWLDISYLSSNQMQGRKSGTKGSQLAQRFLAQRFAQIGLKTFHGQYAHPFEYRSTGGTNMLGYLAGKELAERFIVVTAHYDHLGKRGRKIFNGADDNASGVAAMLALAEKLSQEGSRHSIIFLATDAEERGLYGARAFVARPPVPLTQIRFNLNLDMLAQGGRFKRLYVSSDRDYPAFTELISEAIAQAGICLISGHKQYRRGQRGLGKGKINWRYASDHGAFIRKNIPYLFVGVGTHRFYHTERDDLSNIDRRFFTAAAEASLSLLKGLDRL